MAEGMEDISKSTQLQYAFLIFYLPHCSVAQVVQLLGEQNSTPKNIESLKKKLLNSAYI